MNPDQSSLESNLRALTRLRASVVIHKNMKGVDLDLQVTAYAEELREFDPRLVEFACVGWARHNKFWPTLSELLAAIRETDERRSAKIALRDRQSRGGGTFVERCQRLGVHAGRLSTIGVQNWLPLADRNPSDRELLAGIEWCEAHPGDKWAMPAKAVDPEVVRGTCKLVEKIRGELGGFFAAPQLVALGEGIIRRHILAGTAPPDVASWYARLVELEAAE